MIWHFFEVWVLMLVAFAIGCPIGAAAYGLIARSPLAGLQGDIADVVGDLVDGIKSRLGIGPVWRPEYRRLVERGAHDVEDPQEHGRFDREAGGWQDRLPPASTPMLADHRPQAEKDGRVVAVEFAAEDLSVDDDEPATSDGPAMARPMALLAPRNSVPDDLQRIRGIGRRIEQRLNGLGIFHFGQIAAWTPAEMRWMAQRLAFPDRIERDDWIGQAIVLASGGDTGFVKSADRRRARRRQMALERAIERATEDDDTLAYETGPALHAADAEEDVPAEAVFSEEDLAAEDDVPEGAGIAEETTTSEAEDVPDAEEAPEAEEATEAEDVAAVTDTPETAEASEPEDASGAADSAEAEDAEKVGEASEAAGPSEAKEAADGAVDPAADQHPQAEEKTP